MAASANNGLSVDAVTGKIVLGNDTGGTLATLTSNREIPTAGRNIATTGGGKLLINTIVPSFGVGVPEFTVLADFNINNNAGAFITSVFSQGKMQFVASNAQMIMGSEDFLIDANGSGDIHLQTAGGTDRLTIMNDSRISLLGSVTYKYRQLGLAGSFLVTDYCIDCNGTFALTLPTAVGIQGRVYVTKNSGAGVITLTPQGGQTIDGAATQAIAAAGKMTVMSTGANWIIIA